jgi:hypothetical protein
MLETRLVPRFQMLKAARCCYGITQCPRRQHTAAAPWIARINKSKCQVAKAVQIACSIADSDVARKNPGGQRITGRIKAVPDIQPPKEMFNSAMKDVRKIKRKNNLQTERERAANLARPVAAKQKFPGIWCLHAGQQMQNVSRLVNGLPGFECTMPSWSAQVICSCGREQQLKDTCRS